MANGANPFSDPLAAARGALPVATTSDESIRKLMSSVGTVASNREILKALGAKEKPKTKKGPIATLFDPKKGLFFAPGRFGSALVADIAGLGSSEELDKYNPLESAIRSAKGEFAITGGDVFRTEKGDSIAARLPKLAAALAYDVFTDPLSYVGGVNVLSRGTGAALIADEKVAGRLLNVARETAAAKGMNPDNLTNSLFKRSRIANAGTAVSPDVNQVATLALGDVIGESFLKQGRGGILRDLTEVFNDADIARAVFDAMPDPIRGGLFVKNPITGKPLARIAGGRGNSNAFIDFANEARFRASASKPSLALTSSISGKLGPTLAAVKYGLLDKNRKTLGEFGRTRLTDFTVLRNALAQRGVDIRNLPEHFIAQSDKIARSSARLSPDEQTSFFNSLSDFFHNPDSMPDASASEIVQSAKAIAEELRGNFDEANEYFTNLGLNIGTQKNFVPLKYSDEYVESRRVLDPRQGAETRDRYNGQLERKSYNEPVPTSELDSVDENLKFMTPLEANRVLGENRFETDPIKLLAWYTEWAARTIANTRMLRTLEKTGVALLYPSEVVKIINVENAKHMMNAMREVTPDAVRRVEEASAALKAELDELVSDKSLNRRNLERNRLITSTDNAYVAAKTEEEAIRTRLVELDRTIRALDPNDEAVAKVLRWYGSLGLETERDILRGLRRERSRRAARLAKSEGKVSGQAEAKRLALEAGEEIAGEIDYVDSATGAVKTVIVDPPGKTERKIIDKEIKELDKKAKGIAKDRSAELQSVRDLDVEIAETKALIADTSRNAAAEDIVDPFRAYLAALEEKRTLAVSYDAAKNARRAAKKVRDAAANDVAIWRRKGIDITVNSYVEARQKYLSAIAMLRGVSKKDWTAEQAAEIAMLKKTADELKENFKFRLGYAGKNSNKPGAKFAAAIVDLADRVSTAQMTTLRVLADSSRLDELMSKVSSNLVSRDEAMTAMNDLMRTYRSIRRNVTNEQINELGAFERAAYDGVLPMYESAEKRFTAKAKIVEDDLRAALARNAPASEVEDLEKKLELLTRLTEEKGIRLIGAGVSGVRIPKTYDDVYAAKGVREVMERMYRAEQDPTEWQNFVGKFYDPFALVWKTAATVGRGPSFTLNNLMGGLFNNFLGGVSAADHAVSSKVISAYMTGVRLAKEKFPNSPREQSDFAFKHIRSKLDGLKIGGDDALEVFDEFMASGSWLTTDTVFTNERLKELGITATEAVTGQKAEIRARFLGDAGSEAEQRVRRSVNFLLTNPVQRVFNEAAQASEVFLRFAAFSSSYRKYGSRWAAMDFVKMLHFDYQDLSDVEVAIKRFAPFYTWSRHNVPLQLRSMFLQQDKLRKVIVANNNIAAAFGADDEEGWLNDVLPEFLEVNGGFASMMEFGGNHLAFFPKLPFNDVDKLLQVTDINGIPIVIPRSKEVLSSLGPIISPIEFLSGTSFDTGQQYETTSDLLLGTARGLVPYIGSAQRLVSTATVPLTLAGVDIDTSKAGGLQGFADSFLQQERGMSNLFNFLWGGGVGATTITEKTLRGGLIERSKAQSSQIKKLAAEADLDVEWLRKEIRSGISLPQLQNKIAIGEGKVSTVAARKAREPQRDLTDVQRNALSLLRKGDLSVG